MIELKNITKKYNDKVVLDSVNLTLEVGKPLIILGENGIGKSTLTKIILGYEKPTKGEISYDSKKYKIGYLPEFRGLYKNVTVQELLNLFNSFGKQNKTTLELDDYIKEFELDKYRNFLLQDLSKGNQQKVQLAVAFINNPKLVVLDEPFSGLDIYNQQLFVKLIAKYTIESYLIIITHKLGDLGLVAKKVAMLKKGKLHFYKLSELEENVKNIMIVTVKDVKSDKQKILQKNYNVIVDSSSQISIKIDNLQSMINVLKLLEQDGVRIKIKSFPVEQLISVEKSGTDEKLFSFSDI
ncbi:sodium ABC transporter ATP-binding protein [Ligilactobacillus agilis]|uniref:Sodium ABC transporter ATP-binding protein n=1 Tax=Ligilactobacillus agilis TaxID=1601 RepID=A0A6F9Y204_9LACO|nr:ATP-binding cassette domain-containing protein [Ligilactobacillus agilis]GET11549.1 sodium ABC transporter ATP-binding protein [Ligilactobacillus agilis]